MFSARAVLLLLIVTNVVVMLISEDSAHTDKRSFHAKWGLKLSHLTSPDAQLLQSPSVFTSMFLHQDWQHLGGNMLTLLAQGSHAINGYHILHRNSSPTTSRGWGQPSLPAKMSAPLFLLLYFGSGLSGNLSEYLVFSRANYAHLLAKQSSADSVSSSLSCSPTSFFCFSAYNSFVSGAANVYAEIAHGNDTLALKMIEGISRIGASGCVYGVLSFSIALFFVDLSQRGLRQNLSLGSVFSICHAATVFAGCMGEIRHLGLDLGQYTSQFSGGDNVAHICHGGGAAFGLLFAAAIWKLNWKTKR